MRILHLTQYYPPEPGAVQVRADAISRYLAAAGHQVTVLTEMPNHPKGIIYPEYRHKFWMREPYQGVDVARVWVSTSPEKKALTRLLFYGSYMLNGILRGLTLRTHYDVIYANSPPLLVGGAGVAISRMRRIPFVFEVQDLWPESAVDMGELTNRYAIQGLTWLEETCYRHARRVVVVSDGIHKRLVERGIPEQKLVMVENGSNTALFVPRPQDGAELRRQWGLQDKFIVMYGGIIGLAQGLETVVETARQLQEMPDIHFVLVGEGPRRTVIENLITDYQLRNLTFLPGQPLAAMPAHLAAADVLLAPLRNLPVFEGVRPTKILDAWACRKPVIVAARGEPRRLVQTANAGLWAEPENPPDLARTILEMRAHPEKARQFAQNGYDFVTAHYSLQAMAKKLEVILQECAQGG